MKVVELARIYNEGVEEGKRQAVQRTWVNLTVDELITLEQKHRRHEDLSRAIEAKLKEKNGM
jgi:hypothetical protein